MKRLLTGKNLPGFVFVYFLAVLAVFTFTIAYSVSVSAQRQIDSRVQAIRDAYIDANKESVKTEVERINLRVQELRAYGDARTYDELEERLAVAAKVLSLNAAGVRLPVESVLSALSHEKTGLYLAAFAEDDPNDSMRDLSARFPSLAPILQALKRDGKAQGRYLSPDGEDRYASAAFDPASGLYLLVSVAGAITEESTKREILKTLGQERFGKNGEGYFFVVDESGIFLLHPDRAILGRRLSSFALSEGRDFGSLVAQALDGTDRAFVDYAWGAAAEGQTQYKTSYLLRLRPWGWIVGAGFKVDAFDALMKKEAQTVTASVTAMLQRQLVVLAVAAFGAILMGLYLLRRVLVLEREGARHLNELSRYKLLLDESSLVSRTDARGVILYVNDHFCRATGYTREQVIGRSHNIERHPTTPKELFAELWATIESGKTWRGVLKNRRSDGSSYYKQATILPICDGTGTPMEYISAGQDITELVEQREKLGRVFHTDPLTGLGSRIKLLEDIARAESPVVALIDIVDFGRINDAFGETAGNEVLRECASRLSRALGNSSFSLYRVYADTFALFGDFQDAGVFLEQLDALRESVLKDTFEVGPDTLPLDLRVGTAMGNKDALAYADLALGEARARNIPFYAYSSDSGELTMELTRSVNTLKKIHSALKSNLVYPVFQPIADAASGTVRKFECLMRAADEDGSEIQPGAFIPVSKKTRLYPALTRAIIEKSIKAFSGNTYKFSINLTLEDLFDPATIDFLLVAAKDAELAHRLVVEIVETEELVGYDEALRALRRLKQEGLKIGIDDFGTGYSNFSYLLELDPDYIKIDGSIISRILDDPRAEGLARSIVSFAADAGMKTVAEYVSSEDLARAAAALGVDYLQGYWIGTPRKIL